MSALDLGTKIETAIVQERSDAAVYSVQYQLELNRTHLLLVRLEGLPKDLSVDLQLVFGHHLRLVQLA